MTDPIQQAVSSARGPQDHAVRDQILGAGFDHHLVKPIDTGRLYALLEGVAAPA
ncbi:hypothetical protein LTR94_032641, partial [Friedmanniomyces endolithicus]